MIRRRQAQSGIPAATFMASFSSGVRHARTVRIADVEDELPIPRVLSFPGGSVDVSAFSSAPLEEARRDSTILCRHCAQLPTGDHAGCAHPWFVDHGVYRVRWLGRIVEVELDPIALATVEVVDGDPLCWADECAVRELVDEYVSKQGEI